MNKTKTAVEIFNKYATLYNEKYGNVDLYADALDLFCEELKINNAKVLELACGPGNVTKYILNKRPDLKILGTDLAPNMIQVAKEINPSAEFKIMDCRAIDQLNEAYDAVIAAFCLPYVSKEEAQKLIKDVSEILNKDGLFYISTMEDDYSKSGPEASSKGDVMFMHYHEAAYLTEACRSGGLEIIELSRKIYPGKDGASVTDLIIVARKTKN